MSKKILMQAFEIAKEEALKSPIHNRYGAVIICNNKIISRAHNTFKYNSLLNSKQSILCP